MRILIALLFLFSLCTTFAQEKSVNPVKKKPKNIILLIGDGMGLSEISASQFYNDDPSNFDRFPVVGLIKTSASDNLITDSAAGATAFASGIKTYNGAIGVAPNKSSVSTIVEQLSEKGMATGLIATSSITHATPACFYAHVDSRTKAEQIATFLPKSGIDFFAGGGLKYFSERKDKKNLMVTLQENGFVMNTRKLVLTPNAEKHGFLLAEDGMPRVSKGRGNFLTKATTLALEALSKDEDGFFLMVEGSQIDWGGHNNDTGYLISELIDFDKTIGVALKFAIEDGETLVIVTADHETGGFTLASDGKDYDAILPSFSTDGHSATMVPVFAYGPGEEYFGGIYENTAIYHKMIKLLIR